MTKLSELVAITESQPKNPVSEMLMQHIKKLYAGAEFLIERQRAAAELPTDTPEQQAFYEREQHEIGNLAGLFAESQPLLTAILPLGTGLQLNVARQPALVGHRYYYVTCLRGGVHCSIPFSSERKKLVGRFVSELAPVYQQALDQVGARANTLGVHCRLAGDQLIGFYNAATALLERLEPNWVNLVVVGDRGEMVTESSVSSMPYDLLPDESDLIAVSRELECYSRRVLDAHYPELGGLIMLPMVQHTEEFKAHLRREMLVGVLRRQAWLWGVSDAWAWMNTPNEQLQDENGEPVCPLWYLATVDHGVAVMRAQRDCESETLSEAYRTTDEYCAWRQDVPEEAITALIDAAIGTI